MTTLITPIHTHVPAASGRDDNREAATRGSNDEAANEGGLSRFMSGGGSARYCGMPVMV